MSTVLSNEDLVAIIDDVKDQGHPDTWSVCGRDEVLAMVREIQGKRAAYVRLATVLEAFGRPDYIPVLKDDGGLSAHHHVVQVVDAALRGDPEYESYWRS